MKNINYIKNFFKLNDELISMNKDDLLFKDLEFFDGVFEKDYEFDDANDPIRDAGNHWGSGMDFIEINSVLR
jgi:hypothetical protein